MDLVETAVNAVLISAVGIILGVIVHGVRSEVKKLRAEFREEIRAVRSDLTQVALAVGARRRAGNA